MGRFFRSPIGENGYASVPDSVNEERFKTFADRIRQWGGGGPGLAPRRRDKYSYEEFFGSPPYGNAPYPATETVDSLEGPVIDDGWEPPTPPSSPHFYMKGGRLYASDETAALGSGERKSLLDAFIAANPEMQRGVDAWSKRTHSGVRAPATGAKRTHPGTPSTSGDWTGEQKPISAPAPVAKPVPVAKPSPAPRPALAPQPATVRASGGPRGGVPVDREAWMAPVAIPASTESSYGGVDEYAVGATKKYRDDYARMQRRGNLSLSPAPDEYKTRFDEGMEPAADFGLMFAGGGKAGASGVGFVERAMTKRVAAAAAKADDAYFAAKEAERLKRGLAASARWRRAQYAATEAEVRRAALRRNAEPFWRASENNRNWRAYTRPGD